MGVIVLNILRTFKCFPLISINLTPFPMIFGYEIVNMLLKYA